MKKLLSLISTLLLLLSLCACGGNAKQTAVTEPAASSAPAPTLAPAPTPTPTPTPTPDPTPAPVPGMEEIAGLYMIREMSSEEGGDMSDELALMATLGFTITLELKLDGTGTLRFYERESEDLTWDGSSITADDTVIPYTYDDGVLTIGDEENRMVFARTTEEELLELETLAETFRGILEEEENLTVVPGRYRLTGVSFATEGTLEERLEAVEDFGFEVILELYDDGTGAFMALGDSDPMRWDETHIYDPEDAPEKWGTYQFDGETLYIIEENGVSVFVME